MIWQQPKSVSHRKPLGDRPEQGRREELNDVKSHSHRKLPVGLVLLVGRDAGQRDMWDAGAHEGLCREVWRIHKK